jgi:hypothetical protein
MKMGNGWDKTLKGDPIVAVTVTLTATLTSDVTYTSASTYLAGFNSALIQSVLGTGGVTATVINGTASSGGTMVAVYDKDTSAQMTTGAISSSRIQKFNGLPDFIGLSSTLSAGITAGSSVTITIIPINL